ncbi:16S rRNA methyltransferase [Eubacterium ramulus]|jgi:16S rRNA (guanine527-N7)-methyltransferase|uniref:Ribosomal RNA small subunit methyltransferase G n=1 Tax=Eubacterium ramulus TaxID=39490 RepID=A0A2V1JVX4_EUBRA|nr:MULTISPECIES: 16S rRNA (guanine(527)-N(7))-methyltransferase RsmG [Clostridia]MBS5190929.1 16S rRNA (guanine(527)-N(7))-methyltransferase RsmG [Lachnospiraceae bacterium]PWE86638.1 16S rRNA methyltransferase [Eubacterium ramulus]RHV72112.1 16S rRNA (guanine(527)-N(7))-methyltransferase RsmG [Roseburia sp. OM02-15]
MSYDLTKFKHGLEELNITLTDEQIEQFLQYYEMLVEKNKVMNLTGITEYEEVIQKHFLDSLSLIRVIPDIASQKLTVIDLGTGAGFPGIPLKIAFPELEITLMDSLNKRILFLQEVIDALGLKKVSAVHGRAEEMASNATHRQQYDLCVSRAVSNLAVLTEYCLPFVKKGGLFVSYKSADSDAEIQEGKKAISILGGKLTSVDKFQLPDSDLRRALVCIKKVKDTPKKYPRKAGTPAKLPLK